MASNYNQRSGSSGSSPERRRQGRPGRSGNVANEGRPGRSARAASGSSQPRSGSSQPRSGSSRAASGSSQPRSGNARAASGSTLRVVSSRQPSARSKLTRESHEHPVSRRVFERDSTTPSGRVIPLPPSLRRKAATQTRKATTFAEQKRRMRSEQRRRRGAQISVRALVIAGLIAVLAIAAFAIYESSLFTIIDIRVNGAQRLTNEHLTKLADVAEGETLLRVDAQAIERSLEADAWVESARVERSFPGTLVLQITERRPLALVELLPDAGTGERSRWLVSPDGIWLVKVGDTGGAVQLNPEELGTWPQISDVSHSVKPVVGDKVTDDGLNNALAVLNGFSAEMLAQVAAVSAPDQANTNLTLRNNVWVAFGAARDVKAKESAITTLLNTHPDSLVSINVRVPDRPSYRSTSSP
jgi:cell division protein FtsQ